MNKKELLNKIENLLKNEKDYEERMVDRVISELLHSEPDLNLIEDRDLSHYRVKAFFFLGKEKMTNEEVDLFTENNLSMVGSSLLSRVKEKCSKYFSNLKQLGYRFENCHVLDDSFEVELLFYIKF